jgi:PAS domain S-box-containing protein
MTGWKTRSARNGRNSSSPAELLMTQEDGPLSRLFEQADWPSTPLGPYRDWPPELRTAVSICLNCPFPILVMWGPQLAMVYNDAFVPILGAKHPALGLPCAQVWADAWPVVGGMLTGVLERGEPTYHEDLRLILQRHGFDEEVYFTFAYSPIPVTGGRSGGVFTVVTESTRQVLGARRIRALQELSASRSAHTASVTQTCATAMQALGAHRADLPFGITYLLDDADGQARPVASFGLADPDRLPAGLRGGGDGDWIWQTAMTGTGTTRTGLAGHWPGLAQPGASPAGDADADVVVSLPLAVAGQLRARGALVLGVSRYLRLDEDYQGFLALVARQVAAAATDAEAYAAQRRRAEELAELDRAKTEFFTSVSHELRTPLALIAGPATDGLADAENPLPPAQRRRLEIIYRNSGRLRRMVDMLLDFARIEGGRLQPEPVAVEIGELTRGVAESFASAVERAGLTFAVDCPSQEDRFLVDPDMWEKIVLNLLSNAVKFTLAGVIRISVQTAGGTVELRVSDTGAGIAADQLPLIFERFHQVRGTAGRSHEGSGIGLALVRELARLHGGDTEAQSRVGAGSTFIVRIPARPARGQLTTVPGPGSAGRYVEEARQWSIPASGLAEPGPAGRDAVLVAEDNADMRQYLTDLLERSYAVTTAADGRQALERARRAEPDLILADVMMPGLDGFGLLSALRADPRTARIPVIFLSARAGEEAAIEGLAAGADDYLVKPFSSAELLARVRSNLDLARVRNHESAWRTALVKAMQDGLFVATAEGTVIEINDAFTGLLGYPAAELPWLIPHPWWPPETADPEGFAQISAALTAVLAEGRGRFTLPLRHRDGRSLWADVAIDTVRDRDQRLIVGTVRDITVEHLAAERDAALARLAGELTGINDTDRLLEVALAEIRAVWQAARVTMVTWDASGRPRPVATTGPATGPAIGLPDGAVEQARGAQLVTAPAGQPATAALTGVGAPVSDGVQAALVWLEFASPRSFPSFDRALLVQLCAHLQRALTRSRAYEEQRQVALTLQRSILGPTDLPAGLAVRYEPAGAALEVGGDWYDVVELPEGRCAVVVGDVPGRGLAAATVMGQLRSAGRALLLENNGPAQVLRSLDRFSALLPGADCTTVFCAVIDPRASTVRYSSAGHLPALLANLDGTVGKLEDAVSPALAVTADCERTEATARLTAGSTLLLYTDGLVERRLEVIDAGIQRVCEALADSRYLSPEQVADHLSARLPGDAHADDVALLVYRQPASSLRPPVPPVPPSAHRRLDTSRGSMLRSLTMLVIVTFTVRTGTAEHHDSAASRRPAALDRGRYPRSVRAHGPGHRREHGAGAADRPCPRRPRRPADPRLPEPGQGRSRRRPGRRGGPGGQPVGRPAGPGVAVLRAQRGRGDPRPLPAPGPAHQQRRRDGGPLPAHR